MGIGKTVLEFLFGKDPGIFDDKGRIQHKLPKKKWDDWNERLVKGAEYNWRNHEGTKAGAKKQNTPSN
jgi:hypothetical protein